MDNDRTNRFFAYGLLGLIFPLDPNRPSTVLFGTMGIVFSILGVVSLLSGFFGVGAAVFSIGIICWLYAFKRVHKLLEVETVTDEASDRTAPIALILLVNGSLLLSLIGSIRSGFTPAFGFFAMLILFFDYRWFQKRKAIRESRL